MPLGWDHANALLDQIAAGWREDCGFLLIEGHRGALKTRTPTSADMPGVGLQRADAVRDDLIDPGIPTALIWVKPLGAAKPLVPGVTVKQDNRQNRRAAVFNTRRVEACAARRRRLRVTWFRTHCMLVPQAASDIVAASCARTLDEVEQED